ncbi:MAG: tRNA (N6-threonylcarbamoyladenosine(37)-N6)-methyltransferase TrmO [Acidilobaceae archaeon]
MRCRNAEETRGCECFQPIGFVKTDASDEEVRSSFFGVEGYIVVFDEYSSGLRGLEEFSHLIVIACLHKTPPEARRTLTVKPRRLTAFGFKLEELPEVGVFATDSPHRPNPIALTIVEILEVGRSEIRVRGLDLYNGTPVLDLKPYTFSRIVERSALRVPWWVREFDRRLSELKIRQHSAGGFFELL